MPQTGIRPHIVTLLTEVDYNRPDDRTCLYRLDGSPMTAAEHTLVSTATPAEFTAAENQMRLEDELAGELDEMKQAFVSLLMKYFAQLPEGSVVEDAVEIMTAEDYAEFQRMLPLVTAQDALEYRALHGSD